MISILLYVDDVVLFAENEADMQSLLVIVETWCRNWRLEVNLSKTNILHVRPKKKQRSCYMFLFNKRTVPYCSSYQYLGCHVNEHLDYDFTAQMQADSAGKALSLLITKMIKNGGFPYNVYSLLYKTCVCSVSQYGCEVFGFQQYNSLLKLHLRAARAFLGLSKNATTYGLISELDWLMPQYETRIKMIQYYSRIMNTSSTRLSYQVYKWDRYLHQSLNMKNWTSEIKAIFTENNLEYIFNAQQIFPLKSITFEMRKNMQIVQNRFLKTECGKKPKLRTFMKFKDFESLAPHVGKPLSFLEMKTISQLRLGMLQLRIETARYLKPIIPENERLCYCNSGSVEDEYHAMFDCNMYTELRANWFHQMNLPDNFENLVDGDRFKLVLNVPENVRKTAKFLVAMMDSRQLLNKEY